MLLLDRDERFDGRVTVRDLKFEFLGEVCLILCLLNL